MHARTQQATFTVHQSVGEKRQMTAAQRLKNLPIFYMRTLRCDESSLTFRQTVCIDEGEDDDVLFSYLNVAAGETSNFA